MYDNIELHSYLLGLRRGGFASGFYVSTMARDTRKGNLEVLNSLSELVSDGLLTIRYELKCNSLNCLLPITEVVNRNMLEGEFKCPHCGNELEAEEDFIKKKFYFV